MKINPQVYTNQEGTKNWIHSSNYHETVLCLDSFFRLKVEASTVNLYNYHPLLVPEFCSQARLFLTDIFAIPHDESNGGISRLKCSVESELVYRINKKIIFWDLTNPSAGNCRGLISPAQWLNEHIKRVVWLPSVEQTASVGALETCWRNRSSQRGINGTLRSLPKNSAWFHINFSLAHTSTFWGRDWSP